MGRIVGDEMRYSVSTAGQTKSGDPLATAPAAVASHFPELWLQQAIIHSTSWRYDDERIVLTFLAYSDELALEGLPLAIPLATIKTLPKRDVGVASIAAHAIRNLAFL